MFVKDTMGELIEAEARNATRRHFLKRCGVGLGAMAFGELAAKEAAPAAGNALAEKVAALAPKAKRVIYLHMAGSPPQHDLFDYKPVLNELHMQPCPQSMLEGKKFAFIKGVPKLLGTQETFARRGQSGTWMSGAMPQLVEHINDLCVVKSMYTTQFNHAPAQLLLHTGNQQFGGASMGSWVTYGLGSANENLPGFVVMVSGGTNPSGGKSLWGSSFLPSVYQGVQCRGEGDPVLYVSNPPGMSRDVRRKSLDALNRMNRLELEEFGDAETLTRIRQYELAFRMQVAVPEVMDIKHERASTLEMYGAEPGRASFANNCLMARRLVEQGVRFVQLFDWGWDIHGTGKHDDLETQFPKKCAETDRPIAALLKDLKQRGMLDDTLVVWGGEFGRTPMNEARGGSKYLGRDHHPDCFSMWLAGGGVKAGQSYGETDELGYTVVKDGVGVRDLQATILHLLGLNAHRLSYPFQGLNVRLIGPENSPKVVEGLVG